MRAELQWQIHRLRGLVPNGLLPRLIDWRLRRNWSDPQFRRLCCEQMHTLLDATERADEVKVLAREMARFRMSLAELRWHPELVTRQRVEHLERLTGRDPARGAVLNFMHHGYYYGAMPSLARHGVQVTVAGNRHSISRQNRAFFRQHVQVVMSHGVGGIAVAGSEAFVEMARFLQSGSLLAIASDLPGHTEIDFLGRRRLASLGAARLAHATDSPVYALSAHSHDGETFISVHDPLEPADYSRPQDLLQEVLHRHEPAILSWPEAVDDPLRRWGKADAISQA